MKWSSSIPDYMRGRIFSESDIDDALLALFMGFRSPKMHFSEQVLSNFSDGDIEREYLKRTPLAKAMSELEEE